MKSIFDIGVNAEIKYDSVLVNRLYDGLSIDEKKSVQTNIINQIKPLRLYELMSTEQITKLIVKLAEENPDDEVTKHFKLTPEIVIANGFVEDKIKSNDIILNDLWRFFKIPKKKFYNNASKWCLMYDVVKKTFYIEDDPTIEIYTVSQFKMLLKLWKLDDILNDFKYR